MYPVVACIRFKNGPDRLLGYVAARCAFVNPGSAPGSSRAVARSVNLSGMESHRPGLIERILLALAVPLIYALGLTLRERELGRLEWSLRSTRESAIWSLWHETLMLGAWFYRRARHPRDDLGEPRRRADRAHHAAPRIRSVRGSTSKGSLAATRKLSDESARGPPHGDHARRSARSAAPRAAGHGRGRAALRAPVVAIGIGVERCWRLQHLGSLRDPQPFSRVHFAYSDPIWVPREGGSDADYLARNAERDGSA